MRTPRILIIVLFAAASLFLVLRTVHSARNADPVAVERSRLTSFFSFNTPFALFPPNAAISLTDDNSTFFPARPAAFGPPLPSKGLSGQLWIGSGFADENLPDGEGELGCSDVPGYDESVTPPVSIKGLSQEAKAPTQDQHVKQDDDLSKGPGAHRKVAVKDRKVQPVDDGTDDYLHQGLSPKKQTHEPAASVPGHADIQSIQETAEITGNVVLLSRGGCGFLEKVKWAQRRGATALIVGDNQKGGPLIQMFARGDTSNVTIPAVFTSRTTAHLLSSLMQPGSYIEDIVDENGNPALKVQQFDKARKNKKAKQQATATTAALLPESTPTNPGEASSVKKSVPDTQETPASDQTKTGWLSRLFPEEDNHLASDADQSRPPNSGQLDWVIVDDWSDEKDRQIKNSLEKASSPKAGSKAFNPKAGELWPVPPDNQPADGVHEGLWVTITPTGSASPFFDTLLVLVISPLITLTVVYALLVVRARIRRRRYRAPKAVVDRLPVRTYHTIEASPAVTPRLPSPSSSSPTTPLLQGSRPRPRSRTTTGVPSAGAPARTEVPNGEDLLTVDAALQTSRSPSRDGAEEERRIASQWQRYMGRQVECVVCLEEYVDGVSQVMSLPCGHEFHAECITPWLTTRRRTCPICKGDVVRALARDDPSVPRYEPYLDDSDDEVDNARRLPAPPPPPRSLFRPVPLPGQRPIVIGPAPDNVGDVIYDQLEDGRWRPRPFPQAGVITRTLPPPLADPEERFRRPSAPYDII